MKMVEISSIPLDKKMYLFELDEVLFPQKDYVLQVYYLFAQFVEFTEGRAIAAALTDFMKETYLEKGHDAVFQTVEQAFTFQSDYSENFERLLANAHLPLKLYLSNAAKLLLATLIEQEAKLGVLTKGNPVTQLNKLKHLDWQGLDRQVRVYFLDELEFRNIEPFNYIAKENQISPEDIFFVDKPWTN